MAGGSATVLPLLCSQKGTLGVSAGRAAGSTACLHLLCPAKGIQIKGLLPRSAWQCEPDFSDFLYLVSLRLHGMQCLPPNGDSNGS